MVGAAGRLFPFATPGFLPATSGFLPATGGFSPSDSPGRAQVLTRLPKILGSEYFILAEYSVPGILSR